jgi:hypothetical protein
MIQESRTAAYAYPTIPVPFLVRGSELFAVSDVGRGETSWNPEFLA